MDLIKPVNEPTKDAVVAARSIRRELRKLIEREKASLLKVNKLLARAGRANVDEALGAKQAADLKQIYQARRQQLRETGFDVPDMEGNAVTRSAEPPADNPTPPRK
ncbi:hypothetical protein ACERK3_09395 [Phycisphaerales bacterium AB-hyl4]|uniref:Uncharacterized protein n=1 Tax=Natronomicrosphaera hydrolytica TaxID=3242702 RepID=A0ABV4U7L8_9BACT